MPINFMRSGRPAIDPRAIQGLQAFLDARYPSLVGINLLANPGFETAGAGGADVFGSWTEGTTPTSTLNRDTAVFNSGVASMRSDIDAGNHDAYVTQTAVMVSGRTYNAVVVAKVSDVTGAPTAAIGPTGLMQTFTPTANFETYTKAFTANGADFRIAPWANKSSKSFWFDDAFLEDTQAWVDGDAAYFIPDLSGQGNHHAQTSASVRPTWKQVGISGRNAWSFDSGDQFDANALSSVASGAGLPFTAIAVGQLTSLTANRTVLAWGKNGTAATTQRIYADRTTKWWTVERVDDAGTSLLLPLVPAVAAVPMWFAIRYDGFATTVWCRFVAAPRRIAWPATPITLDRWAVGRAAGSHTSDRFVGYIPTWAVWNRPLPDYQVAGLIAWVESEFGLYA